MSLATTANAVAGDAVIHGGRLAAGPRLVDGALVRLLGRPLTGLQVERLDPATGAITATQSIPATDGLLGWDASASLVAVDRGHFTSLGRAGSRRDRETIDAGPVGGPLQRVLTCGSTGDDDAVGFAVDGTRLAYVNDGCTAYPPTEVVIKDFATDLQSTVPVKREVGQVALAGDYLAIGGLLLSVQSPAGRDNRSSEYLAVYNWRTGQLLNYVEERGSGNRILTITGFDVQSDGKVALTRVAESGCPTLEWFQAGEATRHQLPVCTSSTISGSGVKIAGDRIAVVSDNGYSAGNTRWEFVVTDLAGSARVVATDLAAPPSEFRGDVAAGFDFDGNRLALPDGRCDTSLDAIDMEDLEPAFSVPRGSECPVQIVRRSAHLTRRGAVSFEIVCPQGCDPDGAQLAHEGGILAFRPLDLSLRTGGRTRISVQLKPRRVRRVRREGRIRLAISVTTPWSTGRRERYSVLSGVVLRWPQRG